MYAKFKETYSPSSSKANTPGASPRESPKKVAALPKKQERLPTPVVEEPKDVMISYSHADKDMMNKLKDNLENSGISVWVDKTGLKAGVDFLSKIGQAIIDAKLFISLLSEKTIKSKYCQDELALAYVSNKPIFPVGLEKPEDLFPKMDTGMRLQLARFKWALFLKEDEFDENFKALLEHMKADLNRIREEEEEEKKAEMDHHDVTGEGQAETRPKKAFRRSDSVAYVRGGSATKPKLKRSKSTFSKEDTPKDYDYMIQFWTRNFDDKESVRWESFIEKFNKEYKEELELVYKMDDRVWLIDILRHEMEIQDDIISNSQFIEFCTVEGELQPFWTRVQDQAVESYTVREVFNMESSVRVDAISNLGKFRSPAVIEALLDLLRDKDNNVRAVAAISLAKTGVKTNRVIKSLFRCLEDKDRLVRESGCLALGHLKGEQAVQKLVQMWRNDVISHVRAAAEVALQQIGGEEAEKAMHMTKVLSEEIRYLTSE